MVQGARILKQLIKEVPDFPKPGVSFKDISPLLRSPSALREICDTFEKKVNLSEIELIAGIESRGFILACS